MSITQIDYHILEQLIIPNRLSRKHYLIFNITCKEYYNQMKNNHNDVWCESKNIIESKKFFEKGYRNIRINKLEFFIVNVHENEFKQSLFTSCGRIIDYTEYYYNNNIIIPLLVSCNDNNEFPVKFRNYYRDYIKHSLVFKNTKIEFLIDSYPYSALSRPIKVLKK